MISSVPLNWAYPALPVALSMSFVATVVNSVVSLKTAKNVQTFYQKKMRKQSPQKHAQDQNTK